MKSADGNAQQPLVVSTSGRADAAVRAALAGHTRAEVTALFREKRIRRHARIVKPGDDVTVGDVLEVELPYVATDDRYALPNLALPLDVVRVDDDFVVINKAPGLPSHPLVHHDDNSALSAVLARYPEVGEVGDDAREGGLLHRLDTFTGGALAFARTPNAWERGRAAFGGRGSPGVAEARRVYLALVFAPARARGEVLQSAAPIAHHKSDTTKMVVEAIDVVARGEFRPARTIAHVLGGDGPIKAVFVEAFGGRRHQVRVHLAALGAPLLGDALYGGPPWPEAEVGHHALWAVGLQLPSRPWALAPPQGVFDATLEGLGGTDPWQSRLTTEVD